MDQQAPQVTIVNPNAPVVLGDVLGEDREPWRPTRRQVQVTVVFLVVLSLVGGIGTLVQRHRAQQAKVAAAIAQVAMDVGVDESALGFGLALRNNGPDPIRILAVRLDGPGYVETPVNSSVGSFEPLPLTLSDTATCRPEMAVDIGEVGWLVVRLETVLGSPLTRTVPLSSDAAYTLAMQARERCGYLLPGDAFSADVQVRARSSRSVTVDLQLGDRSLLPLRLLSLDALPGLSVAVRQQLPLTLPPMREVEGAVELVSVRAVLTVTDCGLLHASVVSAEDLVVVISAQVVGAAEPVEVPVLFAPFDREISADDEPLLSLLNC